MNYMVEYFLKEFIDIINVKKILLFQEDLTGQHKDVFNIKINNNNISKKLDLNAKYDLIICNSKFGVKKRLIIDDYEFKLPESFFNVFNLLDYLKNEGMGLFILEPSGFNSYHRINFENEINKKGFYVNAYFNLPEEVLYPFSSIIPIFVLISRKKSDKIFVTELSDKIQIKKILNNYFLDKNDNYELDNLYDGKYIGNNEFKGFSQLKTKIQIENLETQYKNFKSCEFSNLIKEINTTKNDNLFEDKNNSLYVPKVGNSGVLCNFSDLKLKHHNYFQIILKEGISNKFLELYFRTKLGKLALFSFFTGNTIKHLNKTNLEKIEVVLPPNEIQNRIIETSEKLKNLKEILEKFDSEIAINPPNNDSIETIDKMLNSINLLSEVDTIKNFAREGESQYIEFKETFYWDINLKQGNKDLIISSLKTVVGFLNARGGTLLIGIDDNGNIKGLETEIKKLHKGNIDEFLKFWKNNLKTKIGSKYYDFIESKIVTIDDNTIFKVSCNKSNIPCYLLDKNKTKFFVRTNPATDELEGAEMVEYISNHFNSSNSNENSILHNDDLLILEKIGNLINNNELMNPISFNEIKILMEEHSTDEETIKESLDVLKSENLIEEKYSSYSLTNKGILLYYKIMNLCEDYLFKYADGLLNKELNSNQDILIEENIPISFIESISDYFYSKNYILLDIDGNIGQSYLLKYIELTGSGKRYFNKIINS